MRLREILDGHAEETEFYYKGELASGKGKLLLQYEETFREKRIRSLLLAGEGGVSLRRRTEEESALFFVPGEWRASYYETEYGSFAARVRTDEMEVSEGEDGFRIAIRYALELNDMDAGIREIVVEEI